MVSKSEQLNEMASNVEQFVGAETTGATVDTTYVDSGGQMVSKTEQLSEMLSKFEQFVGSAAPGSYQKGLDGSESV